MADPSIAALQQTVNRYTSVAKFAPLRVDGVFGSLTKAGVTTSLAWISNSGSIDPAIRQAAGDHLSNWNQTPDARLAVIAIFLGSVANALGLPAASSAAAAQVATSSGVMISPSSSAAAPALDPAWAPATSSGFAASIGDFWKKLPTWGKVAGGAVFGLGLIFAVSKAGKRKPATSG